MPSLSLTGWGPLHRNRCRWHRALLALLVSGLALLGACTTPPRPMTWAPLERDDLFPVPIRVPDTEQLFALSPEMLHFAATQLAASGTWRDRRQALIDALYHNPSLRLRYDATATRDAAATFGTRAGNCLSLAVMTAAFARHLGLPVTFQSLEIEEDYERSANLTFVNGHINVLLGQAGPGLRGSEDEWLTIDFLPQADLRGLRRVPIGQNTVVAMYLNNLAAEALAAGRTSDAYWWARAATLRDPGFLAAPNTLGVVYQRAGHGGPAEAAYRHVLSFDADHTSALVNLVGLLRAQGREAEAQGPAERLARLQPRPPFWYLDRAREAMGRGEYAQARELLQRELRRQPHQHEVHFGLAQAYAGLGEASLAAHHLALAADNSRTGQDRALYGAKLDRLRAARPGLRLQ